MLSYNIPAFKKNGICLSCYVLVTTFHRLCLNCYNVELQHFCIQKMYVLELLWFSQDIPSSLFELLSCWVTTFLHICLSCYDLVTTYPCLCLSCYHVELNTTPLHICFSCYDLVTTSLCLCLSCYHVELQHSCILSAWAVMTYSHDIPSSLFELLSCWVTTPLHIYLSC